jgi:predicted deacetylase
LVISIHDVSQHSRPAVERILGELEKLGVRGVCSLLVVPDHHRCGPFLDDPVFCTWLKERAAMGDEVVIHGYHHCRDPHPDESLSEKFATRLYTNGEGEFFDILGADAIRLVSEARQDLRTLGLAPRGFIAPAWLLSTGGERALCALKVDYTTRLTSVDDLASGRRYRSQSLVWSTRAWWRRVVSLGWNAWLFRRLRANPLMRISIHPTDIEHRVIWRQVLKLIRLALVNREPISYLQWVETSRPSAHAIES